MIKNVNVLLACCLFVAAGLNAQAVKIDDCYQWAKENYPLVKQYNLIEKTKDFSVENAQKAYLPQFGIYGQATYQSDVTQLPFDFSGIPVPGLSDIKIPTLSKDQYKLYGDISYSLTDLATTKSQTDLIKANAEVEKQKLEVELYKLRERIYALFFGVLLIDAQLAQAELVKKDIRNGIERTEVAVANGVALKSTADNLKAELLKTKQRTTELRATRKGYTDMLSWFTGEKMDENTVFEKPLPPLISDEINRPEMLMFAFQNQALALQNRLITTKNLPRVSLFVQGGFGRPALNMLSNDFDPYYVTGLRLNWNLSGFWTAKNDRRQLTVQQTGVQIQQETFLFNTNLTQSQQHAEIAKMRELITDDSEIISLRENVKNAVQTELENGTATTNDYLVALNAEDQARQNCILHEIQLLMYLYNAQTTTGN